MNGKNLMAVLDALGEKLQSLSDEVLFKDLMIRDLKEQLAKAEKEIEQDRSEEKNDEAC